MSAIIYLIVLAASLFCLLSLFNLHWLFLGISAVGFIGIVFKATLEYRKNKIMRDALKRSVNRPGGYFL